MNFFLDENFPKKAVYLLEELGHTVYDIRCTPQEGLSDLELFTLVKEKRAILLTTDKDFYHTIHLTEKPHNGIIVIALRQPNSQAILKKLEWILKQLNKLASENTCFLLTDSRCTIFK